MKYRKKPVVIAAIRLSLSPTDEEIAAIHAFFDSDTKWYSDYGAGIAIQTLEGVMHANPGDWIIRGVKGEFYPCKPDVFEATYEKVEE